MFYNLKFQPRLLILIALCCWGNPACAQLTKTEAEAFIESTFEKISESKKPFVSTPGNGDIENFDVEYGDVTMRCMARKFGQAKSGSRSLFISMHGGGGTAARVNDQQWRNQIRLYEPAEGFYVAPRAPTDQWDLWHKAHIDQLFTKLIENFVATRGVDPNKVYLMGYSAGGDGVYQLAPRMADRFAAASMMAGHPNDAKPESLFNLPFRIYVGGRDAAYQRNEKAEQWQEMLAKLRKEKGGYPHKVTIFPDSGHWMNRRDAEAVPWMAKQTRNPWPKKIIWADSSNRHQRFYWIEGIKTGTVEAEINQQTISITGCGKQKFRLWLRDELIDLDNPITINVDGKELHSGKIERTKNAVTTSLEKRLDPSMAATATIELQAK